MVSNTVNDRLQRQIAQKFFKSKIKAVVHTSLANIAFHLRPIWLQTLVTINSESRLTSFPSFCVPPSEVAVLFDLNLSRCRRPLLGQVPAALHRIGLGTCCFVPMSYFSQIPMNDREIQQSNGRCLGRQQLLANSINILFHMKKKVTCCCLKFTKH